MRALSVAIEAALTGGDILESYFGGEFEISFKGELDLVTQADVESEAAVLSILKARMPDASILAEESGGPRGDATKRFVVDPLDGTTNFAHAYPMFAVSIATRKMVKYARVSSTTPCTRSSLRRRVVAAPF